MCTHTEQVAATLAARRAQVVELTRQGLSLREIAEKLNVTKRTVSRHRDKAKVVNPARQHRRWTPQEHDRALELIADGCSLHDVAQTLGRSYDSIETRFRGMGWTGKQIGRYNATAALRRALGV